MVWTLAAIIGTVLGIGVGAGMLRWALRSHRGERRPWLELMASSGVDGIADDAGGSIAPVTAPFTGRPCLAFAIEIVVEEQVPNETTFHRVFTDGAGRIHLVARDGRRIGPVDFSGGQTIFPVPLEEYGKYSSSLTNETIFHGPMQSAPPHLQAFVSQLPHEVQHLAWRPSGMLIGGKRVYFNERIVVPGQQVVLAGKAIAHGTLESERARVAKLPVAAELFGAVLVGGFAFAFVMMITAMIFGKD